MAPLGGVQMKFNRDEYSWDVDVEGGGVGGDRCVYEYGNSAFGGGGAVEQAEAQWRATRSKSRMCAVGEGLNFWGHMVWGSG